MGEIMGAALVNKVRGIERKLLERCAQSTISFTYAPCPKGRTHARLLRSTISGQQHKRLHALALGGYVAENVDSDPHAVETTITYTMTARGQRELFGVQHPAELTRVQKLPTAETLTAEANSEMAP